MSATETEGRCACELRAPRRNHYFHGKMLDAYHFQLESAYFNLQRRMLNRLVTGCGVVCGLDVQKDGEKQDRVVIRAGVAIDCCGNEIVVDRTTPSIKIDSDLYEEAKGDCERGLYVHLSLCYHECATEPARVLAGECMEKDPCRPGVILERYKVIVKPGQAPPPAASELCIPDLVSCGKIDYRSLANLVSRDCPCGPEDCCITLANIRASDETGHIEEIDIAVRPIVYTNDLLFQLLLALKAEAPSYRSKQ